MRAYKVLIPALAVLAACSPSHDSQAQGLPEPVRSVPTSAAAMKQSFAPVVKKAAPAVVNVSSRGAFRENGSPPGSWEPRTP